MTRASPPLLALCAILAAAVLWGTTGTLQSFLPDTREPLVVGALRLAIGAFSLLLLASLTRGAFAALRKLPKTPLLVAALGMAAYNLLFFAAVAPGRRRSWHSGHNRLGSTLGRRI